MRPVHRSAKPDALINMRSLIGLWVDFDRRRRAKIGGSEDLSLSSSSPMSRQLSLPALQLTSINFYVRMIACNVVFAGSAVTLKRQTFSCPVPRHSLSTRADRAGGSPHFTVAYSSSSTLCQGADTNLACCRADSGCIKVSFQ